MPIRTGGTAPYAPPAAVLQLIQGFRDRGLATPITPDVLVRAGITESLVPRVLRSLEGLELIDKDGNPTPEMEGLRRVSSDEFKQRLEAIIRNVYAEVFQFTDPATDGAGKIADAFRAYDPIGQRRRMVSLFLGLCEAAGITKPGTARKQAPTGNGMKRAPSSSGSMRAGKRGPTTGGPAGMRVSHNEWSHDLVGKNGPVSPGLIGLLGSIPRDGWTKTERDKFVLAFGHVLDFTVPIRDEAAASQDEAGDDEGEE